MAAPPKCGGVYARKSPDGGLPLRIGGGFERSMSNEDYISSRRRFALYVVRRLQSVGFEAVWAGGCVRDRLLGREPRDYDVDTNAVPAEIRGIFRGYKTLNIGAAFGVVAIIGPRGAGKVEVVTFRRDANYSDGRHPDGVSFSSAMEDAQRRDFTINGLFYDPVSDRLIDYVGGQNDLKTEVIRAIGDPRARFTEDKLRMLRAIRFAAHFRFKLDEQTKAAIIANPRSVKEVSAERVTEELRRMLTDLARATAASLLNETGLLQAILPKADFFLSSPGESAWKETLRVLDTLGNKATFPVALSALIRRLHEKFWSSGGPLCQILRGWKLPNREIDLTLWLLTHENTIRRSRQVPWPQLQRLLVADHIDMLLSYSSSVAKVVDGHLDDIDNCLEKLRLPRQQLNPDPLLTGNDLIDHGIPPSKQYQRLLRAVRDAQLEQRISSRAHALALVDELWQSG